MLSPGDLYRILAGSEETDLGQLPTIFFDIRLPRVLLALLIGAILGTCGALSQGLFRNPLADPSLIGVTAGASAGASLCILVGADLAASNVLGFSLLSLAAFAGGLAAVLLVYRLSFIDSSISVANMLLVGIAVTAFAASLTGLMEYFSDNAMLRRMSLWRMGGIGSATYQGVATALAVATLLALVLPRHISALNVLLLGEAEAGHLGIDLRRIRTELVMLIAAGTGCAVALGGTIAFVGLVVPHMMRQVVGPGHALLIPCAALAGSILMVLADTVSRTVLAPVEIPVGLVTALIGAPFFIYLLRQGAQYGVR